MRRRARKPDRRRRGVTLIELLVVVTIIALFLSVVGYNYFRLPDRARVTAARQQIANFRAALANYKMDTGAFPTTDQGLRALHQNPGNAPKWDGPYLEMEVPNDPWGRPYVYRYPGEHGEAPDIISYGADGQPGGESVNADIVSWKTQ